jgi:hypothetical protein
MNWHQAHLQEVGLAQIPIDHVVVKVFKQVVKPLDESQGLSQLHGHGPWVVCEVVIRLGKI